MDLRTGAQKVFDDVQSFTLSDDGKHVALRRYGTAGRRGADVIVRDLDMDKLTEVRDLWQFYRDRRPDAYGSLVNP